MQNKLLTRIIKIKIKLNENYRNEAYMSDRVEATLDHINHDHS